MQRKAKTAEQIHEKYNLVLDYSNALKGPIVFTNDSNYFYISNDLIYRISCQTLKIEMKLDPQLISINYLTISLNDKYLASGNYEEIKIFKPNLQIPIFQYIEPGNLEIKKVEFLHKSSKILVGYTEQKIDLWNFKKSIKLKTLKFPNIILNFLISQADEKVHVIGGESLKTFDLQNFSIQGRFDNSSDFYVMASTSNDSLLVLGDEEGKIFTCDTKTCLNQLKDENHSNWVNVVKVSPNDKLAATGGMCKFIFVWDIENNQLKRKFERGSDSYTSFIVFNEKSSHIVSNFEDVFVAVWNLEDGKKNIIGKHQSSVLQGEISKDFKVFFTGGNDKILLWNAKKWELIREVCGHAAPVKCVLDLGRIGMVVSADFDEYLKVWDIDENFDRITVSGCRDVQKIIRYKDRYVLGFSDKFVYVVSLGI